MSETTQFVTKDMIMGDIIRKYPSSVYALMASGLGCVGCPSAQGEPWFTASMPMKCWPMSTTGFV